MIDKLPLLLLGTIVETESGNYISLTKQVVYKQLPGQNINLMEYIKQNNWIFVESEQSVEVEL